MLGCAEWGFSTEAEKGRYVAERSGSVNSLQSGILRHRFEVQ